jgi:SAM-dependent methyltransferase
MDPNFYDEAYFERGIESGKSCYQNYRWVPELTVPMAMTILEFMRITREDHVIDFGCAKGFLVKALRLLHRRAWGVDISRYAISQVPADAAQYCKLSGDKVKGFPLAFDICIAKDVFEHIPEEEIHNVLIQMPARRMFAVIPLGDNGTYRAKANNYDVSHVLCKDEEWWLGLFTKHGWKTEWVGFRLDGIKDSYYPTCPRGHGFFMLERKFAAAPSEF